jgi:hypothetical protein
VQAPFCGLLAGPPDRVAVEVIPHELQVLAMPEAAASGDDLLKRLKIVGVHLHKSTSAEP